MAEINAIRAERAAAMPPCRVCGDQDYSPAGACRPCAAERKRLQRERERSPEAIERKKVLVDVLRDYLRRQGIEP